MSAPPQHEEEAAAVDEETNGRADRDKGHEATGSHAQQVVCRGALREPCQHPQRDLHRVHNRVEGQEQRPQRRRRQATRLR